MLLTCREHGHRPLQAGPSGRGVHAVHELRQQRHEAGGRRAVSAGLVALRHHCVRPQQHLQMRRCSDVNVEVTPNVIYVGGLGRGLLM